LKLAILFGGASFEHEISIVSAITVMEKLPRFELTFVFCDQDHTLYLIDRGNMKAKYFASGDFKKAPVLTLMQGSFLQKRRLGSTEHTLPVLNLIHGADGEDGTVASLLSFYGIPFIGPRTDASVLSFDKRLTKWFAAGRGIKTVAYEELHASGERTVKTPLPCIVKPSRLGSSIGVSVVKDANALDYALDVAFEFDESVIVEPFIGGVKEYNLAGYKGANGIVYSIIEEPQKNEFLDFDKKYLDFARTGEVGSAEVDPLLETQLKKAFETIYEGMFEGALIRCDFFVIDGEVYLNEINPIPGSMANYLFGDFPSAVADLLSHLPARRRVSVDYKYIHSINAAKGK
jgi:D-alanine-D-alanine ligase